MISAAFYDTRSYDREFMTSAGRGIVDWRFHEFRLDARTAPLAAGCPAVCLFVNDVADRDCLTILRDSGVRLIALRCAGFNNIDLSAATELGLAVTRVPAYSPHAVAEHTVALLLALNRHIPRAATRVRDHNFSLVGLVGFDLHGKTAGVIGLGKIGRLTAQILRGFGMDVLGYDPAPDNAWAAAHGVTCAPLEEIFTRSDIVSLHTPLTPDTHHLLNDATLSRMKPGSWIVNTSRGRLIDTAALLRHLKSGHIAGAALDVYEEEEGLFFEDHSGSILTDDNLQLLLSLPNVLITAHQAFLTREALACIAETTVANIQRMSTGDYLLGTLL